MHLAQELEEKEEEAANLRDKVLLLEARDRNRSSVEAIYAKMVALGIMDPVRAAVKQHLMSRTPPHPDQLLSSSAIQGWNSMATNRLRYCLKERVACA